MSVFEEETAFYEERKNFYEERKKVFGEGNTIGVLACAFGVFLRLSQSKLPDSVALRSRSLG